MARQCLRLHRPFGTAAEDPMSLSDFDAIGSALRKLFVVQSSTSGRVKSLHSVLSHSRGSVSAWKRCLRVKS